MNVLAQASPQKIQRVPVDLNAGQKRVLVSEDAPGSIQEALNLPFWKELYYAWGLINHIEEEISFRMKVERFEQSPSFGFGKHIYNQHIKGGNAPQQINIRAQLVNNLQGIFEPVTPGGWVKGVVVTSDIFDAAIAELNNQTAYAQFQQEITQQIAQVRQEYAQKQQHQMILNNQRQAQIDRTNQLNETLTELGLQ